MWEKSIGCTLGLLLFALLTPAQAGFTVINLGTLDGDSSVATAINDRGEIVGDYTRSNGQQYAFYYHEGLMRSLSDQSSRATAINDSGQIVGALLTYTTNIFTNIVVDPIPLITNPIVIIHPPTNIVFLAANAQEIAVPNQTLNQVLGTNGQVVTNLVINSQPVLFRPGLSPSVFEGTNNEGYASGINDQGQIVGGVLRSNSLFQNSFVYQKGMSADLPALGSPGESGTATAINNHGDIVGFSSISPETPLLEHAFFFSRGLMQDLGTMGGTFSAAIAINDVGEIAGYSTTVSNAEIHAFFYRQGRMIDLGGLPGVQPSLVTNLAADLPQPVSHASAINNWGEVVGGALAADGLLHAFVYSGESMTDLNDLVRLTHTNGPPGFLTLTAAQGINDWGQIVGTGTYWDGTHETTRAFLLDWFP